MEKHIIRNEKEYRFTKSWLSKAEDSKKKLAKLPESKEQPWLRKAQRGSLQRFINHLKEEVEEYEALKTGKVKVPRIGNLATLHELLIKKRIANGWTSKQLAKQLGVSCEEIENYERAEYANATLETLQKIASVLNQEKLETRQKIASVLEQKTKEKTRKVAAYRLKN